MRLNFNDDHLRPGGTISGPTLFTLADLALYVAVLAQIGPVGLAVTANMNINFLRKPPARDLIGEARLLRAREAARGGGSVDLFGWRHRARRPCDGAYSIPVHGG